MCFDRIEISEDRVSHHINIFETEKVRKKYHSQNNATQREGHTCGKQRRSKQLGNALLKLGFDTAHRAPFRRPDPPPDRFRKMKEFEETKFLMSYFLFGQEHAISHSDHNRFLRQTPTDT